MATLMLCAVVLPATAQEDSEPLPAQQQEAARFLSRATFGADRELIQELAGRNPRDWIEEQRQLEPTLHLPIALEWIGKVSEARSSAINALGPGDEQVALNTLFVYYDVYEGSRRFAWWQTAMTAPDRLRQRVAFALSEIFVVSDTAAGLKENPAGLASYYDVLVRNALGNYRDLLREVTLHPVMGFYLSHLNNARSDPEAGRFADENYARESMQLFSIGLMELRPDGSVILGDDGNPLPTYTNSEITEFARVFTGLGPGGENGRFGRSYEIDFVSPMRMYDDYHEPGEKRLLRGFVVADGQTGMEDVEAAIDNLFHHPNVGPFISRRLIQRLVTSNPSPAYIGRVSRIFDENGLGVRGDLGAVVAAILLDAEADEAIPHEEFGHIKEPVLRATQFFRALGAASESGWYLYNGNALENQLRQHPLSAPSVFNFFSPDHQPKGELSDRNLVAPELQITTSATLINSANMLETIRLGKGVMGIPAVGLVCLEDPARCYEAFSCPNLACLEEKIERLFEDGIEDLLNPYVVTLDLEIELTLAQVNPEALIARLDLLLAHGRLSPSTRSVLIEAISPLDDPWDRATLAIYLMTLSPDAVVAK